MSAHAPDSDRPASGTLEIRPEFFGNSSYAARFSEDRREYDAAARAFEAVWQLTPDHYWTLLELMPVYRQLGRFEDAERLVIHAATVRPRSVRFAVDTARVYLRRGERQLARTVAAHAEALAREAGDNVTALPTDNLEWLRLWDAHEAWLDRDPARVLEAARHADRQWAGPRTPSRIGSVRCASSKEGMQKGLALLESLKPDPMGPRYNVLEHLALARRGLGDSAGAIRELERAGEKRAEAITHDGWQVYSWLRCTVLLAELYRELGRSADAERTAQEVRTLLAVSDPGHPLLVRLGAASAEARAISTPPQAVSGRPLGGYGSKGASTHRESSTLSAPVQ